jgi:hypothetical protein
MPQYTADVYQTSRYHLTRTGGQGTGVPRISNRNCPSSSAIMARLDRDRGWYRDRFADTPDNDFLWAAACQSMRKMVSREEDRDCEQDRILTRLLVKGLADAPNPVSGQMPRFVGTSPEMRRVSAIGERLLYRIEGIEGVVRIRYSYRAVRD